MRLIRESSTKYHLSALASKSHDLYRDKETDTGGIALTIYAI